MFYAEPATKNLSLARQPTLKTEATWRRDKGRGLNSRQSILTVCGLIELVNISLAETIPWLPLNSMSAGKKVNHTTHWKVGRINKSQSVQLFVFRVRTEFKSHFTDNYDDCKEDCWLLFYVVLASLVAYASENEGDLWIRKLICCVH